MLDKGKGPVLDKLQTIQLIEADLQLLMRIFIGLRNQNRIEQDNRFLKHNYRSRKSYSIDKAIVERRLIYDTSKIIMKPTMNVVTDLSTCYDRQLANMEGIALESTGID